MALSLAGGCQGSLLSDLLPRPDGGAGGAFPSFDAGDASSDGESPPPPDAADAGPSPVLVGIQPNPKTNGEGEPSAGDILEAKLTTLAAGAKLSVISVTWRALASGEGPDLAAEVDFYKKHDQQIIVNVAFVDRLADGRPDELLDLAWDSPAMKTAADKLLSPLLQQLGPSLTGITFGRDVDVFIEARPNEREAVEAFAAHLTTFAKNHPASPPELKVAAAVSFEGAVTSPSASLEELLALGDIAAVSYLPGLGDGAVIPASEVATQLDTLIAAAAGKPIFLQAVGYPSDPLVQSSPEKQGFFYESFWSALAPRRASFPWVNVALLHDLGPAACEAYAASQSEMTGGPTAAFFCSLGLFTSAGEEKPAWPLVLKGTAAFASP